MRLTKRSSPLLLFLLASCVAAAAVTDSNAKPGSVEHLDDLAGDSSNTASPPARNPETGTKDAPVDGLDGKPHAGPYVEGNRRKPVATLEDISKKKGISDEVKAITKGGKEDGFEVPDKKELESVMGDRGSDSKDGPKGTEGGVSEKDRKAKESGPKEGKKPIAPTEAQEIPAHAPQHGDAKEKPLKKEEDKEKEKEKSKGSFGLEKPADLPDKPHDIPHPQPPSSGKSESHTTTPPPKTPISSINDDDNAGIIQPFHSFILSLTMIIFSEIGDKTFLVAALMAMRHDRLVVFSAAFSALIAMTVLSAVLGHAVPTLIPARFTRFAAAILFLFFGAKLVKEGLAMSSEDGVGEEMKEVEQELEEKEYSMARQNGRSHHNGSVSAYALEAGRGRRQRSDSRLPAPPRSPSSSPSPPRSPSPSSRNSIKGALAGLNNLLSLLLSPAWVQTFVMTFLGEWGDRSQIATIAMAAGQDYWWITGGAVVGHGLCTAVAVIGGRAIAGKVSMRIVTLGGAGAFVIFGIIYLIEAIYSS